MPSATGEHERLSDPELASLKSAVRAAIVMPAVFAFADKVVADTQTADLFAAFGSFAMLVLAEFAGPPRARFTAYLVAGGGWRGAGRRLALLCSGMRGWPRGRWPRWVR